MVDKGYTSLPGRLKQGSEEVLQHITEMQSADPESFIFNGVFFQTHPYPQAVEQ